MQDTFKEGEKKKRKNYETGWMVPNEAMRLPPRQKTAHLAPASSHHRPSPPITITTSLSPPLGR
jgi:hypothetical protein